ELLRPTRELFRQRSHCCGRTMRRCELKKRSPEPVHRVVEGLLLRGLCSGHPRLLGMCRELYGPRAWLWTFLEQEGKPTNNAHERALQHAVIWRKLSFGTRSARGSRFVETMLTVIQTCRQQTWDVIAYVTAAVQAHCADQPTPTLLP